MIFDFYIECRDKVWIGLDLILSILEYIVGR